MELYIQFSFWAGLVAFVLGLVLMAANKYPVAQKPKTLGGDVAKAFVQVLFLVWAGYLLFL